MMDQPKLHDGFLEGLYVKEDKSARLFFRDIDGKQYELELGSIEYLLANEFREGNIILDLTIQQGKNCSDSLLQRLFDVEYLEKYPEFLGKLRQRIEAERLLLVSIDPSYGCSFTALCQSIAWRTAK